MGTQHGNVPVVQGVSGAFSRTPLEIAHGLQTNDVLRFQRNWETCWYVPAECMYHACSALGVMLFRFGWLHVLHL
jgi:hypothetical protein